MAILPIFFFLVCLIIDGTSGHGRLMDPINRSSMWRENSKATPNYNDDQNNCGGSGVQWEQFDGKCGICGDPYDTAHPQPNENTGSFGEGIIAKEYKAGSIIDINVLLTRNHMGHFNFSICVLEDPSAPESGDDCFKPVTLGDGSASYVLENTEEEDDTNINTTIQFPEGLTCERCVLRWSYTAGNNWGQCEDGTFAMGCGAQETFRSCSDITIS